MTEHVAYSDCRKLNCSMPISGFSRTMQAVPALHQVVLTERRCPIPVAELFVAAPESGHHARAAGAPGRGDWESVADRL